MTVGRQVGGVGFKVRGGLSFSIVGFSPGRAEREAVGVWGDGRGLMSIAVEALDQQWIFLWNMPTCSGALLVASLQPILDTAEAHLLGIHLHAFHSIYSEGGQMCLKMCLPDNAAIERHPLGT
jgi:hypothetical protein